MSIRGVPTPVVPCPPVIITLHFLSGEPEEIEVTAETTFGDVFREYGMYLYLDSTAMPRALVVAELVAVCGNEGHFLAYVSEVYPDVDLVEGWFVWETTGWHWGAEVKGDGYRRGLVKLRTLTRVIMPRATVVELLGFDAVEHVTAPQALKLSIRESRGLKNLHAPVVRDITLRYFGSLKHIILPTATKVNLYDCRGLEALDAPTATMLNLHYLNKLTHVSAPAAAKVKIVYCHGLLRVDFPAAKDIEFTTVTSKCTHP